MTEHKIIIAIDGPAASGKGTIAKRLAETLNLDFMDTGALYRLTGWLVLQAGKDPINEADAVHAARKLRDTFTPDMTQNPEIRTAEAGNAASKVAFFPAVRQALYDLQVHFAAHPPIEKNGSILDGRDIGTVICPQADAKLFITATTDIRAERRTKELQAKGGNVTFERILTDMKERDARDSERATAPLKAAEDAMYLDTSTLNADEAFEKALEFVRTKIRHISL